MTGVDGTRLKERVSAVDWALLVDEVFRGRSAIWVAKRIENVQIGG